ncbi:two-component response regulator ARR11-like [Solanum dulcamara]|uniref:two-component response regulator ARR11-like n=1 Tax=Solanum dulcamara TaxID=45834 RepID=UPI002484E108|nr:two-component response regulator ARR11-like [Solanum dulcamara]
MATPYLGMTNEVCVLLIDHDKEFVSEMVDLLKSYEYKVRTADIASEGMSMLSKGKEKIDVMIINLNSPDLLSFHLLDQAVALDIVPLCVCDKHNTHLAKKAFESGAYLYLQKSLHQEVVKYLWQFVFRKKIQKEKAREGVEKNGDHMHVDDIDSNNIHETSTDVVSNEKCKLRSKKETKLINEEKRQVIVPKTRIEWTEDLHKKFVEAVNQLDEGRCFPTDILELMNEPDLTRYQIASHLQKYRNKTWRVPKKKKSTRHPSGQLGFSSGSTQRSILRKFGTTSHVKMNVTNLQQQQYDPKTQRGPYIPFLPNSNIFSRGESSTLQKVYQPQLQVYPKYLNPFDTPFLPSVETNNVVGQQRQKQQVPLSELLGSQGSNIGSAYYRLGLEFNNEIHHSQNDYALDVATYSIMSDTNIGNATINGLGVANVNFQQYNGEPNMSQPNNIVTTSHVSDTQGSDPNEMINCDDYFDFSNMDFLFQNFEPPSFNLSNEHDNEFDQVYSDDMVASSVQFPDITNFPDDSSI